MGRLVGPIGGNDPDYHRLEWLVYKVTVLVLPKNVGGGTNDGLLPTVKVPGVQVLSLPVRLQIVGFSRVVDTTTNRGGVTL